MKLDDFAEKFLKTLQTPLIAAIVLILLGIGIINTLWQNVEGIWLQSSLSADTSFSEQRQVHIERLTNFHLMGAYATKLKDLPLASLGVTLLGIFSNSQGHSSALIALSGDKSNLYHVGDALAGNVSIEKILTHSIIVKHNGRLERLEMPIKPLEFKASLPESGLWRKN